MYILSSTKVSDIEQKGTAEQKIAAQFFDKDGNGIIDRAEADSFNTSKIDVSKQKLTITSKDGFVDEFESVDYQHPESYYTQGYIPVAVIDDFTMGGEGISCQHGTNVCNTIKSINPDISITKFDTNHTQKWNSFQKGFADFQRKHPKLEKLCYGNDFLRGLTGRILNISSLTNQNIIEHLGTIKEQIEAGQKYEAINMSLGSEVTYPALNALVSKELGVEITPDNASKYKTQIKEILKTKQNETITYYNSSHKPSNLSVKDVVGVIEAMEATETTIYIAGSYKTLDGEENINLYALADNALCVEAGAEKDGKFILDDNVISHNSLALDENGNRRIEDSLVYEGDFECMSRGSTSLATPMALAKALKAKYS